MVTVDIGAIRIVLIGGGDLKSQNSFAQMWHKTPYFLFLFFHDHLTGVIGTLCL